MGEKAITFADPDIYSELYVITASREMVQKNRGTAEKLLRALTKAERFIKDNPDQAKEIVVKYTKLDRSIVNGIWNNFVFAPALTNLLLDYQNQEAAWAKEKGTVPSGAAVPDFRQRIDAEPLRSVKPEAVELR